jgi:transcriptional regulator of heat shock response
MSKERKNQILSAIIQHFVETAQPVGSKTIILNYNFKVSPATIRNDMATLEKEGLLMQPHTSSGRIPTDKGYQIYIDTLADYEKAKSLAHETLDKLRNHQKAAQAKQRVQEAVNLLSQASPNVAFATIPESERTFFMGFSKMLRQPEFLEAPMQASQVMEVIEDQQHFLEGLKTLDLQKEPKIFIGNADVLSGVDSCSIIVAKYNYEGYDGHIGILGAKRMPYAFNTAILTEVRDLLESNEL